MKNKRTIQVRITLLGEEGSGKTEVFKRFVDEINDNLASASIGIDYETKIIKYKNKRYNITIQDTSGEERFRGFVKSYYHFSDSFYIFFI